MLRIGRGIGFEAGPRGDQWVESFGVDSHTAGLMTLTATDRDDPSRTGSITLLIEPGAPFQVRLRAPEAVEIDREITVTIEVEDGLGNRIEDFGGTVHLSSSDSRAVLPEDLAFRKEDEGQLQVRGRLRTAGEQTLTATSPTARKLSGSIRIRVQERSTTQ